MVPGRFACQGQGRRNLPGEPSEQVGVRSESYPGKLRAGPTGLLCPVSVHLLSVAADVAALQEAVAIADVPPAAAVAVMPVYSWSSVLLSAAHRSPRVTGNDLMHGEGLVSGEGLGSFGLW